MKGLTLEQFDLSLDNILSLPANKIAVDPQPVDNGRIQLTVEANAQTGEEIYASHALKAMASTG